MLSALRRYTEAEVEWDRAIRLSTPERQLQLRASRLWTLGVVKEELRAVPEVLELSEHLGLNGHDCYSFACVLW